MTTTVAQLLAGPALRDAELIGGGDGLHRRVADVVAGRVDNQLTEPTPTLARDTAIVLDQPDGYQVELFLPRARAAGVTLLVVCWRDTAVLSSTPWLADRLTLPVVVARRDSALPLAQRLHALAHAEPTARGLTCARVAEQLATRLTTPAHVVQVLDEALPARCTVLGAERTPLAGELPERDLGSVLRGGVAATVRDADGAVVAMPVGPAGRALSPLWLVATAPALTDPELATVRAALSVAAWAVAAWSATQQLTTARDTAFHTVVLSELLTSGDQVSPRTAERAVEAGWPLDGWHIGIRLLPAGRQPPPTTTALRRALAEADVAGPVVELGDGWACWLSQRGEPTPEAFRAVVARVSRMLEAPVAADLVAGIGRAQPGARGLAGTLTEAWDLARIAGFSRDRRRVEHAGAADPRRLVLAAVSGDETVRRSRRLLGRLLEPEHAALLETLETYLSLESSTAATATRLGVHRNTVLKRLDRIETLLDMRITTDPAIRLALRIACSATH